jgi:methionine synthase II (cobalamin-independent)
MFIPTEPIGSVPRSAELLAAMAGRASGEISDAELAAAQDRALRETVAAMEATGSPVISDGEQTKPSFATYPTARLKLAPDGYPADGIAGYSREAFTEDLIREAVSDIRDCLDGGAACVQIDFTEGRLALKLDPSGGVLDAFVDLNNRVLASFSAEERKRIGVHTCPGGDHDSTHSADVDYLELLPVLFRLDAGRFYIQLASEPDRRRVLDAARKLLKPDVKLFVGVTDPISRRVETAEEVRDRVLEAAEFIPLDALGTTDDCGFSPFADDTSTSRETAFQKIRSRVEGTQLASQKLGA